MKILHIIVGLEVGGAELMLKRLALSSFEDLECQHEVVSLTALGAIGLELQKNDISVTALGMRGPSDLLQTLIKLIQHIRKSNPTIVQTWMYHADLIGGIAARLAGHSAIIWGIRTTGASVGSSRVTAFIRKVCASLSHYLPRVIVCAAEAARTAHIHLGYDAKRMVVIPNGFELTRWQTNLMERGALREICNIPTNSIVIGCVGRFNPVKDFRNFVQAAGIVAAQSREVRFLMIGRNLDESNLQLVSWIHQTGYRDRFTLLGERADMPICLSAMDIFALSSRTEGFPNVVGEAMAMELPCVVTNVGDAASIVANTGLVVPKEDAPALADGLLKIIRLSVEERKRLGQLARYRIESEYSMSRTCDRFSALYIDLRNSSSEST